MKNMTPEHMAQVTGGKLLGPEALYKKEITDVVTDSRKIQSGCLFAAIRGERADGHAFIGQVIREGAGAVLAEYLPEELEPESPVILVESVRKALQELAAYYLDQMQIPTVGIVGSAGKTSTKEMVSAVLSQKYCVLKTEGNFNNELGVPLTIFRIREEHQIAVIEMGINHFGEMRRLAKMVRPDTVVMTNIGTAHLEFLIDRDGILRAKSEVLEYLRPEGQAILNGDDDKLITLKQVNGKKPIFYAVDNPEAEVRAENVELVGIESTRCRIITPDQEFEAVIPVSGLHAVHNALAGAAVGYRYGLTKEEISAGIAAYKSLAGRFQVLHTERLTIIDDSYNANPSSVKASLRVLQNGNGRRVAVLGDMGELGKKAAEPHREVGEFAGTCGADVLYCIGTLGKCIAEGARESAENHGRSVEVHWFPERDAFMNSLSERIRPGDIILVKASRFMGFEKIVKELREL